ncbi:hypothetical protein [Congregibacter sp.]|uniref:hypothetical protein n=1 Tax=Congregibacter sp. TaxID=2744308 RepID=UPI003F6B9607
MASKLFKECLEDVYQGELTGEVGFEGMLAVVDTDEQRYIAGSMLQLETEGKARMRPILMRYGLSVRDIPEARSEGEAAGAAMNQLPWEQRFAALGDMIQTTYLPRYEELATLITIEEDSEAAALAKFMGDHERALLSSARKIAAGELNPAEPVVRLLQFPLLRSNSA